MLRLSVELPDDFESRGSMTLSPDGRMLVFGTTGSYLTVPLWLRRLDGASAPVAGTEGAAHPFWSPDSRHLAFLQDDKLKRVPVDGGSIQTIGDWTNPRAPGAWSRDGFILFSPTYRTPIHRVADNGGVPQPVTRFDTSSPTEYETHQSVVLLPDGDHFIYRVERYSHNAPDSFRIGSIRTSDSTLLISAHRLAGLALAPGHLLYLRGCVLVAHPFDVRKRQFSGEPLILEGGRKMLRFSASQNGVLAYLAGDWEEFTSRLQWYDRSGQPLGVLPQLPRVGDPRLSPDGRFLALRQIDKKT